ncbi:MAG: hypothetical protein NTY07_11490 [Bacteroidia bacterium]|nr:hypothetical protein [Bacteroidia bacterium]
MPNDNKPLKLVSLWEMSKVETIEEFYQRKFDWIPDNCENLEKIQNGFYCIFNQHFFHKFGDSNQNSVFQYAGNHVFELSDEQVEQITGTYKKMFEEIKSDYIHKYDVLRNLVFELLHFAMKIQKSMIWCFESTPFRQGELAYISS